MKTAHNDISSENKVRHENGQKRTIGAALLAEVLDVSKRTIERRSCEENWLFEEEAVRGGKKKLFPIRSLPTDIQRKVLVHLGDLPEDMANLVPLDFDRCKIRKCSQEYDEASPWQRNLARDRLEILERLDAYREEYTGRRSLAVQEFVTSYLLREIIGIDPAIYRRIPVVKRSRLYEWEARFKENGIAGLISKHGASHKGASRTPLNQQQMILGILGQNPCLKSSKIAESLKAKFGNKAVSARQVAEFIRRRKAADPALFAHIVNPDDAKGRYQLALGSASDKAERYLQFIEVDSTPADVMCVDGRRYTIVGGIDIFSRKARFVVTKTSNSWAIAGLVREIATGWGLPEHIVRDNGQDYASKMVNDGLMALGVKVVAVPPFTPEAKPHIERVFRTLSHDLLESLPGYIGHNVAERKGIENRKTFAERIGKASKRQGNPRISSAGPPCPDESNMRAGRREEKNMRAGTPATTGLTPKELQAAIDRWTEDVYHQRNHSTLGMSPNAKASKSIGVNRRLDDMRALDILLAPSGQRTVGKKGIRYENGFYWGDGLIDWIGRPVTVRSDVQDAAKIYCFDPETRRFICEAQDLALEGITLSDKIRAKKTANKRLRERAKAVKELGKDLGDIYADEIANLREERATVRNLPTGEDATNLWIEGALEAAEASRRSEAEETMAEPVVEEPEWAPRERQRHQMVYKESSWRTYNTEKKKVIPMQSRNEEQVEKIWFPTPLAKFDHYRIRALSGLEIDEKATRWLEKYADQWRAYADMFSEDWSPIEKRWIAELAPQYFGQYLELTEEEPEKD